MGTVKHTYTSVVSARGRWRLAVAQFRRVPGAGYLAALAFVGLCTVVIGLTPLSHGPGQRAPLYLIPVLASGAMLGMGPAVLAAGMGFLAYDWFFVQPLHQFAVANSDDWEALLLFLAAALVTGQLTAMLRRRAADAARRTAEAVALQEIGNALVAASSPEQALGAAAAKLRTTLDLVACDVLLPAGGELRPVSGTELAAGNLVTA